MRAPPGYDFQDLGLFLSCMAERGRESVSRLFRADLPDCRRSMIRSPGASLGAGYSMGFCEIVIPMKSVRESDANNIGAMVHDCL